MFELTEREQTVLLALIERHVQTAEPVSSQELCEHFNFQWSSATVRNVMASLQEKGWLQHPYTSAGKLPTVQAYRYLVERLCVRKPGQNPAAQERVFELLREVRETDRLIRMTAKVLAMASRLLAVTWLPNPDPERLARVQLYHLSGRRMLLVAHTLTGGELQQTLDLEENISYEGLQKILRQVNERGCGLTAQELEQLAQSPWPGLDRRLVALTRRALLWIQEVLQAARSEEMVIEGAANLIRQPEFNNIQATRELVSLLDDRAPLVRSLSHPGIEFKGVRVVIGEDVPDAPIPALSWVMEEIPWQGDRLVRLGVAGPRRMAYERIIPLVQEVARTLVLNREQR